MNREALQLLSRFAYSPNKLGYCGLNTANVTFEQCLFSNTCDQVPEEVTHFKGLYPYLKTIAQITHLDMFDYRVIEAYWLGNDLLKQFQPKHYALLVQNLKDQHLPDFFIDEISQNLPKAFIPLHLFNVLYIGVGKITGSVPFNMDSINNCMVRWGPVTQLDTFNQQLEVQLQSLAQLGSKYTLNYKSENLTYDLQWLPDLKTGDIVAVHWLWPTKILTETETSNLSTWTTRLLTTL